jgi:hypothetical protein
MTLWERDDNKRNQLHEAGEEAHRPSCLFRWNMDYWLAPELIEWKLLLEKIDNLIEECGG